MNSRLRPKILFAVAIAAALMAGSCPPGASAASGVKAGEIPKILTLKGKKLTALKAVMAVSTVYNRGKSHQEIRGFFMYRRPRDFRFQGIAAGGNSLFEMVLRAGKFQLYVPTDRTILKGGSECFRQKFPDVAELETLIPLALLQWKRVRFVKRLVGKGEDITIEVELKGETWRATLEETSLLLKRLERFRGNVVETTANFSDYGSGDYGWLPRRFDVKSSNGRWRSVVKIQKLQINPYLVEKNFKLEPAFSTKTETCR